MKKIKKIVAGVLAVTLIAGSLSACGKSNENSEREGKTVVEYWTSLAMEEVLSVQEAIDWYNENNTDNIYILFQNKPSGSFSELLNRTLTAGVKGPDLFSIGESGVKSMSSFGDTGVLEDITPYIENDPDGLSGIEVSTLSAYRYNRENMTVGDDAPLYALPISMNTAVMVYNATVMKEQGIIVVSVDAEDIDAFNNGEPDNYGKTKEDYGITWDIRPRGFDRWDGTTDRNYIKGVYSDDGVGFTQNTEEWVCPTYEKVDGAWKVQEKMVFNNRIAMNWDEVEDIGRILSGLNKKDGPNYYPADAEYAPSTDWGFYTRYWFAYGWGVGGAACKDTTGNGDWEFSLGEKKRYCLLYEKQGDTENQLTDKLVVDNNGRPIFVEASKAGDYQLEDKQYLSDPLPSQYQAFERFFYQQKPKSAGGLYIGPRQTMDIGGMTELAFFTSGRMAMYGHFETSMVLSARKAIGDSFEWDIAPVPVYKSYGDNGELENKGAEMFYSISNTAVAMWNNSPRKEAAYKVMKYLSSGKYQEFQEDLGLRLSPVSSYNNKNFVEANKNQAPANIQLFAETLSMRFPDENTYFPDGYWVTHWCEPLNSTYREGTQTFDEFLDAYKSSTDEELKKLKVNLGIE